MKTRQIVCWLLCAASPALAQVSPWSSGTYAYDGSGNVKAIGADYYVYDQVGRLVRGSADKERSGVDNYQAYTYDAFGNRLTASTTGTQCVSGCGVNVQVNNANRVTDHSATYDAAGNLKHFDTNYYTYDGAGMLVTVSSSPTSADAEYIYTANDERLAIYTGGGNWRFTVRDLDAKVVREVTAFQSGGTTTWTWHRDHIFRDGLLLATVLPEGTQHYHLDHLGTPRLVTDGTGRKLGVHAYYPFGDELSLGLGEQISPERLKYTGHERDDGLNGTSLDDMHARYYSSSVGRFLSVDSGKDWDPHKPQSWNMYAYVRNNPINTIDPTGRWGWNDFKTWMRDTRADISNWWHEKWHKDIPPPPDKYGGVEALEAADLSPADAQQMGNPQANWANARAEAGAIISDQATEEVMAWGVGKAVGMAGVVVFGHGARHLIGTVLEKEAVEGAIEKEIQFVSKEASQTGSFWGRVTVDGKVIEYRAFTLPDGTINVGTYYTPKP